MLQKGEEGGDVGTPGNHSQAPTARIISSALSSHRLIIMPVARCIIMPVAHCIIMPVARCIIMSVAHCSIMPVARCIILVIKLIT